MAQTKIANNQLQLDTNSFYTQDNLVAGGNITITEGLNNVLLPSQTPVLFHFDGNNTNSGNGTGINWNTNPSYSTAYPKFGSAAATGSPGFSILGQMSQLLNSSSPYSMDVWARTPAEGLYFGFMNSSWSPILRVIADTNTKEVNLYTGTSHKFYCEDIAVDTYIHYALTHNGQGIFDLYVNGKKVGRVDIGANPSGLYYFSFDGGGNHTAVFDEFAIHNYARFTGDSFALQTQPYVISSETPTPYYQINADLSSKQAALTTATGYDATKTQVLKNINGVLTWVDEA